MTETNQHGYAFGNASDVGRIRQANEDYFGSWELPAGHLFVVCDGMGGHVGGAVASRTATESIHRYVAAAAPDSNSSILLHKALLAANAAVLDAVQQQPELQGMGTTAVVALIRNGAVHYGHVGDSRIYLHRGGQLVRLTKDHSLVQMLVDNGHISEAEAETHPRRNEISRALGIHEQAEPAIAEAPLQPAAGDQLLLCTDGLTGMVSDAGIAAILNDESKTLQEKTNALIAAANEAGGTDNITVQIIGFGSGAAAANGRFAGEATGGRRGGKAAIIILLLLLGGAGFAAWNMGWVGGGKGGRKIPGKDTAASAPLLPTKPSHSGVSIPADDSLLIAEKPSAPVGKPGEGTDASETPLRVSDPANLTTGSATERKPPVPASTGNKTAKKATAKPANTATTPARPAPTTATDAAPVQPSGDQNKKTGPAAPAKPTDSEAAKPGVDKAPTNGGNGVTLPEQGGKGNGKR